MARNYSWGILSTGKIAHKFVQDLPHIPNAKISAVCSRNIRRAQAFADEYGITQAYGSIDSFLQDEQVDIVYVASPHSLHKEQTISALRAGKHVLCEKPIALNASDAEEMYSVARQENRLLMEAMWTVFLPHFKTLENSLHHRLISNPEMLRADFSFSCPYDPGNRVFDPRLGGGALLDVGIYPVMIALELFGPTAKISAQSIPTRDGVDASTSILIQHRSGQLSVLSCSIQQDGPRSVELLSQNGRLEIGPLWWKPAQLTHIKNDQRVDLTPEAIGLGYHYEARHIHHMLSEGRTQSDRWTPEKSIGLIQTLDEVRTLIGLNYSNEIT